MVYATYFDTRFCHGGKTYADNITLVKCYTCGNCNSHIFEHLFIDDVAICPSCGISVLRKD